LLSTQKQASEAMLRAHHAPEFAFSPIQLRNF
jgi:hypothetical protein